VREADVAAVVLVAAMLELDQVVSAAAHRVRSRKLLIDEAAAQPAQFLFVVDPLGYGAPAVVCGAVGAAQLTGCQMNCAQWEPLWPLGCSHSICTGRSGAGSP
jgi:hypothetical protein